MGSLAESMGGPVIGKQYCLFDPAQYTIKHAGKKPVFTNKWEISDASGVVVFEAIRQKTNSCAWSFKYETRVTDAQGKLVARFKFTGSKWQVFDGESDEVVCTVKEDKLDLKVFRAFNSPAQNQPDYKTKTNNMSLCMPWSLAILHEKQPLAEVSLKKSKWLHLNEYLVEMNEGADAVFVLLLVLMMHDMERMFASVKTISISPYRFYPALTF
jgi:hypothetical protein